MLENPKAILTGIVLRGILWALSALLIKRGYDQVQVDTWAHQLTDFIVGAVLVLGAIGWSYAQKHQLAQKVLTTLRYVQQPTLSASPATSPAASSNVKPVAMLALVLMPALLFVGGCAPTPIQRVVQLRETYATTLDVLSDARAAGKISDADYRNIEAVRVEVAKDVDELEKKALAGDTVGFDWYLGTAGRHLDQLLVWRVRSQRKE